MRARELDGSIYTGEKARRHWQESHAGGQRSRRLDQFGIVNGAAEHLEAGANTDNRDASRSRAKNLLFPAATAEITEIGYRRFASRKNDEVRFKPRSVAGFDVT